MQIFVPILAILALALGVPTAINTPGAPAVLARLTVETDPQWTLPDDEPTKRPASDQQAPSSEADRCDTCKDHYNTCFEYGVRGLEYEIGCAKVCARRVCGKWKAECKGCQVGSMMCEGKDLWPSMV